MAINSTFQVSSLPGSILVDIAKIKEKDKKFKDVKKKLKKNYSVDKISKLQQKYIKDPVKFKAEFQLLVNQFVTDYTFFRESYGELLRAIIETLNAAEQTEYAEVMSIEDIIEKVEARAQEKPGEFYFPEKARKTFAKELKKALENLAAQLQRDYNNISGLTKGKKYVMGFFSRFISSQSAERKGMKAAGKVKEQLDHAQEVVNHISLELSQGIQQDFLILFLQYLTELERTDDLFKQLKDDLEIIIQDIEEEIVSVIEKIAPFLAAIQNDVEAGPKIAAAREAFVKMHTEIRAMLGSEEKWDLASDAVVQKLDKSQTNLLAILAGIEKQAVQSIINDVMNKELGR